MQSSKIEFLLKYNDLLKSAINNKADFPENLCEFIVNDYDLYAAVLFRVKDGKLVIIGRSSNVKQTLTQNEISECLTCNLIDRSFEKITFLPQVECAAKITDFVLYEGCLCIPISKSEYIVLKVAKKSPFIKIDKDNLETIGETFQNLLKFWTGGRKNVAPSLNDIVVEISHELRTPTNSILGFASLLNEDNLTSSQAEYVSTLKENAFNLLSLMNDMIDIGKVDKGIIKENVSDGDIKNLLEEIIKIYKDKLDISQIEFLIDVEDKINGNVRVDFQKLRFILLNIISFSLRMTDVGRITIQVTSSGNKINFRISDTGIGISSNKLKSIFEPFVFFEIGNKIGNITGLGLTLTKKYIELLSGEMEVTSTLGKGTTFNFNISSANSLPKTIEDQLKNLPKPDKKNKILVVEDDYATSKLLSNYLNKWGYEPTIVNSAEQALKLIEKEIFLAILMDVVLPDANGFELLKQIREHKNTKNTPVIVCSVEADQQKAFLMGAVEYFVKPIKYKYLVEVLTSYKLKRDSNILIVDDDVPTLNLMKQAVEQAGYNAIAEYRSSRVMNMIQNMNLDLAIIDLDMPEVNGFDLIKSIKTKKEFAKLPVIIYTGKENYKEDLKKIDGMFEDLLHKSSSNIEDLADTINQMINRYEEPTKPEDVIDKKDITKILLVEDYKHSQIIVTRLLKKNNFEYVVVVENGAEAIEQVVKQKFDLILMDMQMPVMNGFEATEKIREMEDYKETPIIALTAFAMKGDREKCINAGATDYIPKPIDSQEFIEKVKYYTESKVPV